MVDCDVCGDRLELPYKCSRCGSLHCADHRFPQSHDCNPVKRSDRDERDQSTSPRSTKASASTKRAPGSKDSPTASSPDVNADGSIDTGVVTRVKIENNSTTDRDVGGSGFRTAAIVIILVAAAAAGLLIVSNGSTSPADQAAAGGVATETPVLTSTSEPTDGSSADSGQSGLNTTEIRLAVHDRVNQVRVQSDSEPLNYRERTAENAQEHSEQMAASITLEHSGENQYLCRPLGENVAYTYAASNVETESGVVNYHGNETEIAHGIVSQWKNSETHRENLLDDDFAREGIGVATAEVEGRTRVYVTQALCG